MDNLIDIRRVIFPESHYLCICHPDEFIGEKAMVMEQYEDFEIKYLTPGQFAGVILWGHLYADEHLMSYKISNVYINKREFDSDAKLFSPLFQNLVREES